jgi:hypothetical protein
MHEVRHWAQVAALFRSIGLQGEFHNFLFSAAALGGEAKAVGQAARADKLCLYTPQPYRSACSSVRCISSRKISVNAEPPTARPPGSLMSGVR